MGEITALLNIALKHLGERMVEKKFCNSFQYLSWARAWGSKKTKKMMRRGLWIVPNKTFAQSL